MTRGESYDEFVEKFKARKTTDDCLTPEPVYQAVKDWVFNEYQIPSATPIVRPFWPGANYQAADYPEGCLVLDNPPFSILSQIKTFYLDRGIPFFLFAPSLTLLSSVSRGVCHIAAAASVTYANGAQVSTGFVTSLEPETMLRSAPDLTEAVEAASQAAAAAGKRHVPAYTYPLELLTAARCGWLSQHGVTYKVPAAECQRVPALDAQRAAGKAIFGGGLLISERAAAERAAAERAAAERAAAERAAAHVWELSPREQALVKRLGEPREPEPPPLLLF